MKNIEKGYMTFAEGFHGPRGAYEEGHREFDWATAMKFIDGNADKIESVSVGLAEDWSCTSGEVYNGDSGYIPQSNTYVYASSIWATPAMEITYKDGKEETVECWVFGDNHNGYFEITESEAV